jgi:hypothetical protein
MSAPPKCHECGCSLTDGVCCSWENLPKGGRRRVLLCVRCALPSGWQDPEPCVYCGVDVYELQGTPQRKHPACNDKHRRKARHAAEHAARLKPYKCKFCGARGESVWPRDYCCEACAKKGRRGARAPLAPVVRLERVKSSLRTICSCGEKLVNPAPECGFCCAEREDRERKRREALERLGAVA